MTLKTIIQNVGYETKLLSSVPSTIVGNSNPDVQALLRLANKAGLALMKKPSRGLQALRSEQTFTADSTEELTSALPADFDRFVPETFWDRTNGRRLLGPIDPVKWQNLKAAPYSNTSRPQFCYRGGSVFVIPTFAGTETLAFEYVSKNWCQSSGGTGQTAWAADTDTGVIDEELITRLVTFDYLEGEGQPSGKAGADFLDYYNWTVRNEQAGMPLMAAGDIFAGTASNAFTGVPSSTTDSALF